MGNGDETEVIEIVDVIETPEVTEIIKVTEVIEVTEIKKPENHDHSKVILVSVYTTSGVFPSQGQERAKETEIVSKFLREAAKALHLTGVDGWVVTLNGREINPDKSFFENGLTGTVTLLWGPREGGGG